MVHWQKKGAWALALLALAAVFLLYAQPDFVVQLSNQIWGCF